MISETKMSKPCDKTKAEVRFRRERNLVAKNNKHQGGYHSPVKYVRPKLENIPMLQAEIDEWWELNL
jgi:hypothetical protein